MASFAVVVVGWLVSLCLHEFGHAIVAYWGGDTTVREKGYLTFNPLKYTHPVLTFVWPVIILLFGGIGLPGGAVYIREDLLRTRMWRVAVSLAGPAMNALVALIIGAAFLAGWLGRGGAVGPAFAFLLAIQISAVVLNMLPVPGLDGFGVIGAWLPDRVIQVMHQGSNVAFVIIFILIFFVPIVNAFFWDTVWTATGWFGVTDGMVLRGWREFRFWE